MITGYYNRIRRKELSMPCFTSFILNYTAKPEPEFNVGF